MTSKPCRSLGQCLVVCLSFMLWSLSGEAAQTIRCDLQTCITMALTTHPKLKVSKARQAAARSEIDAQQGAFKPTLELEGETGYLAGQSLSPFAAISGVTEDGIPQRSVSGGYYQATVGIDIPLVKEGTLMGRGSDAVQQAHLKLSEEEWGMQGVRLQVAAQVVENYIEVLKQRRAIAIYEGLAVSAEVSFQASLARHLQDLTSRHDMLIAEVRFASVKRDLSVAHLNLHKSQRALGLAMGLDRANEVEPQELQGAPFHLQPVEQLLSGAQETNPELKVQQLRRQESAAAARRIESERYPVVSLTAHYGVVDAYQRRLNDQFLTAVKVKVPLFDFGQIKNRAQVARARIIEEEQRLLDSQHQLEREIYDLYLRAEELGVQGELLKKQIEQATEAVKLNRAMYQQQLLPLSAVIDAEAAIQKLQLALSDAEYGQQGAHLRLALLSGTWIPPQP
jgi:outer membrane protein TolC